MVDYFSGNPTSLLGF